MIANPTSQMDHVIQSKFIVISVAGHDQHRAGEDHVKCPRDDRIRITGKVHSSSKLYTKESTEITGGDEQ